MLITQNTSASSANSQGSQTPASTHAHTTPAPTRRSSRSTPSTYKKPHSQDIVGFLAGLNVSMSLVATVAQEIISLYTLWGRYQEDGAEVSARASFQSSQLAQRSGSVLSSGTTSSTAGTPLPIDESRGHPVPTQPAVVTPAFLTQLLLKMREEKMADMAHPATGRPAPLDRRLERAQAAGM